MKRFIFGCTVILCGTMAGCTSLICSAILGMPADFYVAICAFIIVVGFIIAAYGGYAHTIARKEDAPQQTLETDDQI